ncbi:MAG TPA: molecular chaperone TorD family protein [Usitatibacteraceae bacterium]|nr:molecular chaperone TorD family protein [Usitatibacteraceae bacterium]
METVASRVDVAQPPVPPEESARADFYSLLAAFFHHPPEGRLLRTLALAPSLDGGDKALAEAWSQLVAASDVVDEEAVAEEFEALFVGVGKAKVPVYAGHFTGALAVDHPRVRIIEDLAALGLAHPTRNHEPEDHFSGLFEAMRVLVAGGAGRAPASLAQQKQFFESHVRPGAGRFFAAVREAPESNYYRKVAAVGEVFVGIENESFNLG